MVFVLFALNCIGGEMDEMKFNHLVERVHKAVLEICVFIVASVAFLTLVGMSLYKHFRKKA